MIYFMWSDPFVAKHILGVDCDSFMCGFVPLKYTSIVGKTQREKRKKIEMQFNYKPPLVNGPSASATALKFA